MTAPDLSRRTVLKTLGTATAGAAALIGPVSAHRGGLKRELAEVRSATASYNDPANAYADGYAAIGPSGPVPLEDVVTEAESVCGMGFHFGDLRFVGALMSGDPTQIAAYFDGWDRTMPQVLAYGVDDDDNLILGAVEYVIPDSMPQHQDLFDHDGGAEEWQVGPFPRVHSLHAWVHNHNPDGVFNPTNPRHQFHPEGCHDHEHENGHDQ